MTMDERKPGLGRNYAHLSSTAPDLTGPVVVGVNRRQPSRVVLTAAALAAQLSTRLVCAWVDRASYVVREHPDGSVDTLALDPDAAETGPGAYAEAVFRRVDEVLTPPGPEYTFQALAGDPASALARFAAVVDASLIVVGTRERGGRARLDELFTGSIAVHLAHHQSCPVVVVPLRPRLSHTGA
jgi:nucleotide-binding universal stress UspA family protein